MKRGLVFVSLLIFGIFCVGGVFAQADVEKYKFIDSWGGERGDGIGQFKNPRELSVDNDGYVYVIDNVRHDVQKFDSDGRFILKFGTKGTGDGQFIEPSGIAVDKNNFVYIIDQARDDVQKFDSDGRFILKWGKRGNDDGQFLIPYGIAIDSQGNVYVVDGYLGAGVNTGRRDVQKFDSDGRYISKWGGEGITDGKFLNPFHITVDNEGYVYVIDNVRHDVQKFDSDGRFILKFGKKGEVDGEFTGPRSIAIDSLGYLYVLDRENVQKFDSDGRFILKFGGMSTGDPYLEGKFIIAVNIFIDRRGDIIYVLDNYDIQKFKRDSTDTSEVSPVILEARTIINEEGIKDDNILIKDVKTGKDYRVIIIDEGRGIVYINGRTYYIRYFNEKTTIGDRQAEVFRRGLIPQKVFEGSYMVLGKPKLESNEYILRVGIYNDEGIDRDSIEFFDTFGGSYSLNIIEEGLGTIAIPDLSGWILDVKYFDADILVHDGNEYIEVSGQGINKQQIYEGAFIVIGLKEEIEESIFIRGDADSNGQIQLTDAVFILNWLFIGGEEPKCIDASDTDDNGDVNIADAIRILNFLFQGGTPPAIPYPDAGTDPTDDRLSCLM